MGSPKELLRGPLFGFWAWLLCGVATGAALPVTTEQPFIEDDISTPDFPAMVAFAEYFEPTLPTTIKEDFDLPDETIIASETNGERPDAAGEGETSSPGELPDSRLAPSEGDSAPLVINPKTFKIPEDLKGPSEVPSIDQRVLSQVNSSETTLEKETLEGEPPAESQQGSKETPAPLLDEGHEAEEDTPEPSTDELGTLEDPSSNLTIFPSSPEDPSETRENVDAGSLPSPSSEDSPETPPSVFSTVFPSIWPSLTHAIFGSPEASNFAVGSLQPSPASVDSGSPGGRGDSDPVPSSSGPELNRESPVKVSSEEPEDLVDAEGLNSSPSEGTTDAPSDLGLPRDTLSGPSQLDVADTPLMGLSVTPGVSSQWPKDVEMGASSTGKEEDSGYPKSNEGTSFVSPLPGQESAQGTEIPDGGRPAHLLNGTASSMSPGVETANSELEGDEATGGRPADLLNGTASSLSPGVETANSELEGDEATGGRPADLLNGTASSVSPGVETANSELEGDETTAVSDRAPEDEIHPISLDSESEIQSETLSDGIVTTSPPVDSDRADEEQEPAAETQGAPTEASSSGSTNDEGAAKAQGPPAEASPSGSTNEPSSETEGNEVSPSGSLGNIGSSSSENNETIPSGASDEVDTQANDEGHSGSDLLPPDAELSLISGTPLPTGRSGTLDDQLSSSQSLAENGLTSASSSSSEGEPPFPSTSPDEALSGSLISEPDTSGLLSDPLSGSQPSSQLPNENDTETDSGSIEDSPPLPPVDDEGAAKAQGPPTEASSSGSTNEPSSETEGNEVSPSGSLGNIGSSSSENNETIPSGASDEVDTQANDEGHSGSDLLPPDAELSSISGTPLPTGRSGTLDDQLSPSQSLAENGLTSASSSSSEGEPPFPSTSPDEALSGSLISEPDTSGLLSDPLSGSQPSSQLPNENDTETDSGGIEDSPPLPPVDDEGAAKAQGRPAEASSSGSTNEPSSETEGNEVSLSGSLGNIGSSSSENNETIPSGASDEVDTQANEESHSGSNISPSDAALSSISGTPLPNFSQLSNEDGKETHSEDPEDSVSTNRGETSSALSATHPEPALAEAAEEPSISGDFSNGPILSPEEKRSGPTLEQGVNEESLPDSDSTQDTASTVAYEQHLDSEDALETSILSSGGEPAAKSGIISPLVDTEASTKTQEPTGETPSSASIEGVLPSLEHEDGEPSPDITSQTLDSSLNKQAVDEGKDGEDGAGSASSAKTAIIVSSDGQLGSDFPVGQLVTSPIGGILALAPLEGGEILVSNEEPPPDLPNANVETILSTTVSRKDAPPETGAVSSEDIVPQPSSSTKGVETSAPVLPAVASRPSPVGEASPEISKETERLQTSAAREKESPLASSTTESREDATSEDGGFSGALTKESPAFPVEVAGAANSPPATDKASQVLPESVAPSDGAEDSEDITDMNSETPSQSPLGRGSESKTSTSEEDTGGRSDGGFSLKNNGTETTTAESAKNAGSQLPPGGTTSGIAEGLEGPSGVNGEEGSLIPSATGSHATSTSTEEVESADSESWTHSDSQPSLDGPSTTEVQDYASSEAVDNASNNGVKLSLTSSATTSQSPGTSVSEDISGGIGNGVSSLPAEEVETTSSGSANNSEAPSSVTGGATETSGMSIRVEQLESSSSAKGEDASLAPSATESSGAPEDQEVSGKPSSGDDMETANSKPATDAESQPSPNDLGPGVGSTISKEEGTPQVSDVAGKKGTLAASAVGPPAISSSSEEADTSNTATNADSQLLPDGGSAAGTPPPNGAEISKASSSIPLSPSTAESVVDSSSVEEVGTASRKSTTDVGSQLSADGTSPDVPLASEGAEPTESHSIASVDKASLVPPTPELQFPETPAHHNILGELVNGEPSLSPGEEVANSGSPNNAGSESQSSQTSPDVATGGAETSEDNSVVSEKQLSLAPSSTGPQSPGASVSQKLSENLVNGEPSLSTDGGKDAAKIGTAGTQGPTSSTGTSPNQNNIAEQTGQYPDLVGGQFSADGTTISKSSDETLISTSVSAGGNLATQGTSQNFDAPDSSQPSSAIQGNLANGGSGEDSALSLAGQISNSDTFGASDGPTSKKKADGEVLPEVSGWTSEGLDPVSESAHPSSAEGTQPAAGQPSEVASPLTLLPPNKGLLLITSGLGALKLGKVVGKGSSPSSPEGTGEVVHSILPTLKEISTALSASGVQPSLLDTKGGPAKTSKLASGKPGLQGKVDAPLLSSKPEIPAKTSKLASGKPGLQAKVDTPPLSSKPEIPAKTSKLASGKPGLQGKVDAPPLSSKPEVPAKMSKLASGKPGLQGKVDTPPLSSKPEIPAKMSKLASGKPGLQGKVDAPPLSSKPEVPAKTSKLASGKPGLQGNVDAPLLSSKTDVPVESSQLPSGKSELRGDAPLLSFKTDVPVESSQLPSGKSELRGDAPLLSFKTDVPVESSQLPSGKSGLQLRGDAPLLSFNSDVLANSEHLLPGQLHPASSDSSSSSSSCSSSSSSSCSSSEEKDGDSSSGPNFSEEHQALIKGKVALDLSKTQPDESEPGVRLALSGVGLLTAKSSEVTNKKARKKSDLKKSKTRPAKNSAIITGAPSAVSLYPYGDSVNDKRYVERKVDFNSPLFKPEIGIPIGNTLHNALYFTDNGQIIFPASDKDISSYPNPPPGGFNGREKVPMVAVFWDNADFSKGSGAIFYQEYPCGNSARHPLVQDVEAKIRRYIRSSYRARWLLKVTWDKVQAYPGQKRSSETNTYQAILTTDGYRTYALFLYRDGGMQWDYAKLSSRNVLIGYTSGDGYFKNDNLMMGTPAEKYRPDRFQGYNTDVRGLWIYKLESRIRLNYRQKCLDWLSHERLPSAWNRNLPPCPCSLQQGLSDGRYTTSQKGGQSAGLALLYSSRPNSYGAGVRCLYNKNDQLQEGRQERIWKKSRKNFPNNDEELKLHDWCCNKAGNPLLCDKYDEKRPRIGCQGYKPPNQG